MNNHAIIDCLRHVELFQDISDQALRLFAESAQPKKCSAGEILFHREDDADTLFVIESGSIQLFDDRSGSEQSVTVFSRNEFIGETILIAPEHKHDVTARALVDTRLFRFD
ncbi:cyclic nucleotide-binding domain-containing protein, partial [Vibrio rotiferianus]